MKENNLTLFSHPKFGEIRVQQINGEPLFCLSDVCKALELRAPDVKRRLPDDVVSTHTVKDSLGRNNLLSFVNEDGLYDVILDSKKPEARKFRKWVTSEVLPQIRKTGGYIPVKEEDDEKTILCKAVMILQRTIEKKDELISDLAPKAEYTDKVLQSPTCYTMTQVAKGLSMTVFQLTLLLIRLGIIYRSPSGPYMLYKKYLNRGLEAYRTKCGENLFGEPLWTDTYLLWQRRRDSKPYPRRPPLEVGTSSPLWGRSHIEWLL